MKETLEFWIFKDYYSLLPKNNAKFNGSVYILNLSKEEPLFQEIGKLDQELRAKYDRPLLGFWNIKREYTKKELSEAKLFHFNIKTAFEPTGEECGTVFDETVACEICGANRKQIGPLRLKKGSIPKKDISRTIGGEVVVSEKFKSAVEHWNLRGIILSPINYKKEVSNYFQLSADKELDLSSKTVTGDNPYYKSAGSEGGTYMISGYKVKYEKEVYICPKGDLIGMNLLSEPYVKPNPIIEEDDFFASRQQLGAKQGLLRPHPLYLCSPRFRQMVEEEHLSGFEFEVAHIDEENEK